MSTTYVDWRDYGALPTASDNTVALNAALTAGSVQGLPVKLAGAGTYLVAGPAYYYPLSVVEGSPGVILKHTATGALFSPASAPGQTMPVLGLAPFYGTLLKVRLSGLTIDMNFLPGAAIVLAAVTDSDVGDFNIYNLPPYSTWTWTDGNGSGAVSSAGIAALGGNVGNVENVHIHDGIVGNDNTARRGRPWNWTNATNLGAVGVLFSAPPQDLGFNNPPNGNTVFNVRANYNTFGFLNEYGSDNTFRQIDGSQSSVAGVAIGTYGKLDIAVNGTVNPAGGDKITITFLGRSGFTPYTVTYTTVPGDTPQTAAVGLAAAINGNSTVAAQGISATVGAWPLVTLAYGEGQFDPLLFDLRASTGGLTLGNAHTARSNVLDQPQLEGIGMTGLFIGPNAVSTDLKKVGSYAGTFPLVLTNHGGPSGSLSTRVTGRYHGEMPPGTPVASATGCCVEDLQPYTAAGSSALELVGTNEWGVECDIVVTGGGPLTVSVPGSPWGTITIMGAATAVFSTSVSLFNDQGNWVVSPS